MYSSIAAVSGANANKGKNSDDDAVDDMIDRMNEEADRIERVCKFMLPSILV